MLPHVSVAGLQYGMSKDHYVAQTYLRRFANERGKIVPYYKRKNTVIGSEKPTSSVCFEMDGDRSDYLSNRDALDEFLRVFEDHWSENIDTLSAREIDLDSIFEVAGYIARMRAATPTAKRIGARRIQSLIRPHVDEVARQQLSHIAMPAETRTIIEETLNHDGLSIEIDPKFPHAYAILSIASLARSLFAGAWLVLFNQSNMPFITSDNPVVVYRPNQQDVIPHWFVPLTPTLSVLIHPADRRELVSPDSEEIVPPADIQFAVPKEKYVREFNEIIVKSAEERVL